MEQSNPGACESRRSRHDRPSHPSVFHFTHHAIDRTADSVLALYEIRITIPDDCQLVVNCFALDAKGKIIEGDTVLYKQLAEAGPTMAHACCTCVSSAYLPRRRCARQNRERNRFAASDRRLRRRCADSPARNSRRLPRRSPWTDPSRCFLGRSTSRR